MIQTMLGERIAESRRRAGLAQIDLAVAIGRDRTSITHVEAGRSRLRLEGAAAAARELGVSLDYLVGLTDDPTPAAQRVPEVSAAAEPVPAYEADSEAVPLRHIEVVELAVAAGAGAEAISETVTDRIAFRTNWLTRQGINPVQSVVITVAGESMEPTLPDGCSILVDRSRRRRRAGGIFVLRTEDGLVAKRLGKNTSGHWEITSDNPEWERVPWAADTEIIGEVRWMGRSL